MKTNRLSIHICIFITVLLFSALACGLVADEPTPEGNPPTAEVISDAVESTSLPVEEPESTATTEPTDPPVSPDVPLAEEYLSQAGGFAFRPIPDFELDDDGYGFVTMLAPGTTPDTGPGMALYQQSLEQDTTLDAFYEQQFQVIASDELVFSDPRDVTVAGLPGRRVDISGIFEGNEVAGYMTTVLVNPRQGFVIICISPADQWDSFSTLAAAVEGTVRFMDLGADPVEQQPSAEIGANLGEIYYNQAGGYQFQTVPGFSVDENGGQTEMVAPNGNANQGPAIIMMGDFVAKARTLDELYADVIFNFGMSDELLSEPVDITVGGAPGRSVDVGTTDGGVPQLGRMTVVLAGPNQIFVIGGVSPADDWPEFSEVFEAVQATLTFFDPDDDTSSGTGVQPKGEEIRQWARIAYASSSYGDPDWHASQATGAPDVSSDECVDSPKAWASSGSDTVEWLELNYETPVIPTEINIFQTHSPDQIVKVELIDMKGLYQEIYTAEPRNLWDQCPYTLSIPVDVSYGVIGLKITIDQSIVGTTWNEIDAVELVGLPFEETSSVFPQDENSPKASAAAIALQDPPDRSPEAGQVNDRLFEGGFDGYAIRPINPMSGSIYEPLGICGYRVVHDGEAL